VGNISDSIFKLNTKEWITANELTNSSILLNINDKNTTECFDGDRWLKAYTRLGIKNII